MMIFKITYFIKLFLITALSVALLGSVGAAPDRPVFFAVAAAACFIGIRVLWVSALKDEKKRRRRQTRPRRDAGVMPQEYRRAA